jgi:hypothetical protein
MGRVIYGYFSLTGVAIIFFLSCVGGIVISFFLGPFMMIGFALVGIYLVVGILFLSVIGKIFSTALYLYADTGVVPDGFPPSMLASAFKPKKKVYFNFSCIPCISFDRKIIGFC